MAEPTFTYRGRALAKCLCECIKRMDSEASLVRAAISEMPQSVVEAASKGPSITRKDSPEVDSARKLLSRQRVLAGEIEDAKIWLHEAKRSPWHKWTLDLAQVKRLLGGGIA